MNPGNMRTTDMNEVIRQAQTDAQKNMAQKNVYDQEMFYSPTYFTGGASNEARPKALIPVGSEVTIVDFPVRDIDGMKGTVQMYESVSNRYKVEIVFPKKGPQVFLIKREMLQIDSLQLPVNEDKAQSLEKKQAAAKEILSAAASGRAGSATTGLNTQTQAALNKFSSVGAASPKEARRIIR